MIFFSHKHLYPRRITKKNLKSSTIVMNNDMITAETLLIMVMVHCRADINFKPFDEW
jgi:hypothetical protein